MKIKYSPCKSSRDTVILKVGENSLEMDGELFEFDESSVEWEDLHSLTAGAIHDAHRQDGELFLTVLRKYKDSCSSWDTGDYHVIEG